LFLVGFFSGDSYAHDKEEAKVKKEIETLVAVLSGSLECNSGSTAFDASTSQKTNMKIICLSSLKEC